MSYYTKYRPQTIAELDLITVRTTLQQVLSSGKFSHAYMFSGPKGTGKTSSARIMAKVLNCAKNDKKLAEPCNKCENCQRITRGSSLDCLEMDAASNRGIDDIRSLRERVGLAPAEGRYTVYIIDEVHMLTTEAFNALLKTLEEPPAHAVFILCTTDTQKIPETVMSRCTKVTFTKANKQEVMASLKKAVKGEKLIIDDEALGLIADSVDGSFRDGAKILEQLVQQGEGKISLDQVKIVTGMTNDFNPDILLQALMNLDMSLALGEIESREKLGVDMFLFGKKLLELIRIKLLTEVTEKGSDKSNLLALAEVTDQAVSQMKLSALPQLVFEVMIINWCAALEKVIKPVKKIEVKKIEDKVVEASPITNVVDMDLFQGKLEEVMEKWAMILAAVKPLNHSLEALLRSARPAGIDNGILKIEAFYKFHKEQLEQDKHRHKLEDAMAEVLGGKIRLEIILGDRSGKKVADDPLVQAAEEIFG